MSLTVQILFGIVYSVSLLLGLWTLQNAVRGLVSGAFLVPDFEGSAAALKEATRRESPFWLSFFLVVAVASLGLSTYGFAMLWELQNGLGRFDRLFPRPETCTVLYLQEKETHAEAGLACRETFESVYRHYLTHATSGGWQTTKRNSMMMELIRGDVWVRVSVVRLRDGDESGNRSKIILELRE